MAGEQVTHNQLCTTAEAVIAFVDPLRSGYAYLEECERRKIPCVAIQSGLMGDLSHLPVPVLVMTGSETDACSLVKHGISHVIGCVDPSVRFVDELCAAHGFSSNGLQMSEARRNKAKMIQAVAACGVDIPVSAEVNDAEAAVAFSENYGFPVVVKPVESGGSDNVHLCANAADVRSAVQRIVGSLNLMGGFNTSALVQEYIDGDEYAVDCVSFRGDHRLVDCFRYEKGSHNGGAFVYEKEWSIALDDALTARLHASARMALDALAFRAGPSHMELKVTSAGRIVFIEVGPRLSGGNTHLLVRDLRNDGKSQVELALDSYLALDPPEPALTIRHGVRVYVICHAHGVLKEYRHIEKIEGLPSFRRTSFKYLPGDRIAPTKDLATDVGWIDLANEDHQALCRDEAELSMYITAGVIHVAVD